MKSQEELDYEERVKRRVLILKELLEQGKINVAEGMRGELEESLKSARFDENGEPDLSTIDSRIRSMALVAEHIDYIEKTKNAISLFDIQRLYFERIDGNFNFFYKQMLKFKTNPHELASSIAYGKSDINHLNDVIEPILKDLQEFWEAVAESGYLHLDDHRDSIKGVFGGDLFPAHNENIASKCGIYTDTIVLPCPFIRCREFFTRWSKEQKVYFLIKHALNVLQYKELALADVSKPIVVILPDKEMMDEFAFEQIKELGEKDSLHHASKIFGRNFESTQELFDFAKKLDTIEKVFKEIKDENRILFDVDFKEPLKVQIQNQMSGQANQLLGTSNPGIIVAAMALGRMSVCNEILIKSAKVNGIPLIDAPTSWEYFKWKLEYDTERTFPNEDFSKLHIVKGLEGLSNTNLKWIGKIPPKGLIELRKTGAIDEIRQILSKGIDEIVLSNELDFLTTSNKVLENLHLAFKQHEESINKLIAKKWKVAGKDFGSWIVMGSVEIASACIGTPLYGLSTLALNQILDAPKIKDLPKTLDKMKEIENEKANIKRSPLGLIFKYK
jgi:hypothetical protein